MRDAADRPTARGKFLWRGDHKLYVRGATYGTFAADEYGNEYLDPARVSRDFAQMAAAGLNAVRVYTVPPRWLLDLAQEHGLLVLIGLPCEQPFAFLGDRSFVRSIERRVRDGVRACACHPSVLAYAVGNEIPAQIVRWHGRRRVERFVARMYDAVKEEDPGALVTYVNYPSTEYLQLPFLDLVSYNLFLELPEKLDAYLGRLQNIADDRPLLLTEIGLDSRRNGEQGQAETLDWQLRTAFAAGCAGAFVFAWTDEWARTGYEIEDWDFGLTDRSRRAKPALAAVSERLAAVPFPQDEPWPHVTVAVCTRNGARTLGECLEGVARLEYPSFECVVVDDGSSDATAEIAESFDCRLVRQPSRGLAAARNRALAEATGELIAYLDDDAVPDPHWLTYLAATFATSGCAAVGGPNIPPPDVPTADCVANAPGGPLHVLVADRLAEHIPGCNMAFRVEALEAIGGFDPQFRAAGDDVDVCWRLSAHGYEIGFNAAAMVWHRRRNTLRAYLRQQRGYGRAEAMLERKWPEKYSASGHLRWAGSLYGRGLVHAVSPRRWRIYYGSWGQGLFQSAHREPPGTLASLPLMPEWYLALLALAALAGLGPLWRPLYLALPLLALALGTLVVQACLSAATASYPSLASRRARPPARSALTALLYLIQPLARLSGRLGHGLTPWRRRGVDRIALPRPAAELVWSESWRSSDEWLRLLQDAMLGEGAHVVRGGDYDRWDLHIRSGPFSAVRLRTAVEEHGAGRQLVRVWSWPTLSPAALAFILILGGLAAGAALQDGLAASAIFALAGALLGLATLVAAATATSTVRFGVAALVPRPEPPAERSASVLEALPATFRGDGR